LYWSRELRWQQIVFNLATPRLSIWVAAAVAGIRPLISTDSSLGLTSSSALLFSRFSISF
jgi:hypothetical protein